MPNEVPGQVVQLYVYARIDRVNVELARQAERHKAELDAVYQELVSHPKVCKAINDSINELTQVIASLENSMPDELLDELKQLGAYFQQAANDFFANPSRESALTFFQNCNQEVNDSAVINSADYPELEQIFCRILLVIGEALASVGIFLFPSPPGSLFYHAKEVELNVKTDEFLATVKRLSPV